MSTFIYFIGGFVSSALGGWGAVVAFIAGSFITRMLCIYELERSR